MAERGAGHEQARASLACAAVCVLAAMPAAGCGGIAADDRAESRPPPPASEISALPVAALDRLRACLVELGGEVRIDADPLVPAPAGNLRVTFPDGDYAAALADDNRSAWDLELDVEDALIEGGGREEHVRNDVEHEANVVFYPAAGRQIGDARVAFAQCLGAY